MTTLKSVLAALLTIVSISAFSQSAELLTELPTTKEEFVASEKKLLNTIDWLEATPVNQEAAKRQEQKALLVAWITNSPTVTLEINTNVLTFTKKNPELLIAFMGGWTRYALQNNYSSDAVQGSLAGIKSAIKVYKAGLLEKDKEMAKIIAMDEKGELEAWIKSALTKKK